MDLQAEYTEFFDELGPVATYTYKFFDLFKINLGTGEDEKGNALVKGIHWSKDCSDDELSDDHLKELKSYVKQVKSWIRREKKQAKASECRRKLWFFVQKLLEVGAFTRGERREIILWMDNFNFVVGVKVTENEG